MTISPDPHTPYEPTVPVDTELWKPVEELDARYEISSHGRLRSVDTFDSLGRIHRGQIIKAIPDKRGYPRCRLSVRSKAYSRRIHRLVAQAFIPNPDGLPQVNHENGIKTDNHHSNLTWSTNKDNAKHARQHGLIKSQFAEQAPRFMSAILVYDGFGMQVDTLLGNADMKTKGYDWRNVNACLYGTRKTHRGMTFKRATP